MIRVQVVLVWFALCGTSIALEPKENDVHVRVADVGAGLCCVVRMPEHHYMVYDAGNWKDKGKTCLDTIHELVPADDPIDLMVLSHTDSDHLGAVPQILDDYTVERVLHTGAKHFGTTSKFLPRALAAIKKAVAEDGTLELNLHESGTTSGPTFQFGDVSVTMVCGFGDLPPDWDLNTPAEKNNAPSIVIRLAYKGKTILFSGDAVGRHIDGPPDQLIATERFMVEHRETMPIDSDVLIAPHHGGDNASARAFIAAVKPTYVVFSAGHEFEHPRGVTAKRYLDAGIPAKRILRTDWGDDEGDNEWAEGRVAGQTDKPGDDDVDIIIHADGTVAVDYHDPQHPAPDP